MHIFKQRFLFWFALSQSFCEITFMFVSLPICFQVYEKKNTVNLGADQVILSVHIGTHSLE